MAFITVFDLSPLNSTTLSTVVIRSRFDGIAGTYTAFRFRIIPAGTTPITINEGYIGINTVGETGVSEFTPVTFANGNLSYTFPITTAFWSDWIPFDYSSGEGLVISLSISGGIRRGGFPAGGLTRVGGSASGLNPSPPTSSSWFYIEAVELDDTPISTKAQVSSLSSTSLFIENSEPKISMALITFPAYIGKYIGPQIGIKLPCQSFCFEYYNYSKRTF